MSEEQLNDSIEKVEEAAPASKPVETKDEFVSRKAFEEVSRDMHKNKAAKKELLARAVAAEAALNATKEAQLVEDGKWKEAYEKVLKEKEDAVNTARESSERSNNISRRNALKAQLGNVRDDYLVHADLSEIELDENGIPSSESVIKVANDFRQNHAGLLPVSSATKINAQAATSKGVVTQSGEKSLSEMTTDEKVAYLENMRKAK